jgi:hypothetical protein
MITDKGNIEFVDTFGTIYRVNWEKINTDYQIITETNTPFRYGERAKHIAAGQSPNLTFYALGRRTKVVQLLRKGLDTPINQQVMLDEDIYVPVSPNALKRDNPFRYIIDYAAQDMVECYCLEGSHFTYDVPLPGEQATIWPEVNINGDIVSNNFNLVHENIWSN